MVLLSLISKIFLTLFVCFYSLMGSHRSNLISLNGSLQSLTLHVKQYIKENGFLLGPLLESTYPSLILAKDPVKKIYQLKVLEQLGSTCQYHALRNSLYIMHVLASQKNEFYTIYKDMIDSTLYTRFQNETGCPSGSLGPGHKDQIITKIKNRTLPCMLIPKPCLPKDSMHTVVKLVSMNAPIQSGTYKESFHKNAVKELKAYIKQVENVSDDRALVLAHNVAIVIGTRIDELLEQSDGLLSNDTYNFSIDLNVHTVVGHGVCLVVNKYKNDIEFIFLDSLNAPFPTAWSGNYKNIIDKVVPLFADRRYFKEILIRWAYWGFANAIKKRVASHALSSVLLDEIKSAYETLEDYSLFKRALYKDYYQDAYRDIIEDLKNDHLAYAKKYQEWYDKF